MLKNNLLRLSMVLALGAFATACGDDDPAPETETDTGADTPTEDTPMGDTPMGDTPMEDVPEGDTPEGDASEGGACTNEADMAILADEAVDVTGEAQTCGLGCLGDDDPGACSAACVAEATGISSDCAGCYGDTVLCSADNCLAECAMDPASEECGACQEEFCLPAFYACTGLEPSTDEE